MKKETHIKSPEFIVKVPLVHLKLHKIYNELVGPGQNLWQCKENTGYYFTIYWYNFPWPCKNKLETSAKTTCQSYTHISEI